MNPKVNVYGYDVQNGQYGQHQKLNLFLFLKKKTHNICGINFLNEQLHFSNTVRSTSPQNQKHFKLFKIKIKIN